MVIDYSETINRYTELDEYLFPDIEELLAGATQDRFFFGAELKSAYHQITLEEAEQPYFAFKGNCVPYQLTRLALGLTNAVCVFQRNIDKLQSEENLGKTMAYLDDVIVSGSSKEEHDCNVNSFGSIVRKYGPTLNESKFEFRVTRIALFGHLLEDGTKQPDTNQLKALMEYPVPQTKSQLQRLLGFFAYNAKLVTVYSNKIRPHLDSFKQSVFPLDSVAIKAIKLLKDEIVKAMLSIHRKWAIHYRSTIDPSPFS